MLQHIGQPLEPAVMHIWAGELNVAQRGHLERSAHANALIGMVHAKRGERDAAFAALDEALRLHLAL